MQSFKKILDIYYFLFCFSCSGYVDFFSHLFIYLCYSLVLYRHRHKTLCNCSWDSACLRVIFSFSLCVFSSLAGSWTTWNTTWSWKSRTARAGKATRPATTATDSTWLRSSCSATSRALTARLNLQVNSNFLKEVQSGPEENLVSGSL